jgi:hypothetical protein
MTAAQKHNPHIAPTPATDPPPPQYGRRLRAGLLLLLVFAGFLAAGAVLARNRLDSIRQNLLATASERLGGHFSVGTVAINGLRGLVVNAVRIHLDLTDGPSVLLDAPKVRINIDLADLLAGRITLGQVSLEGAVIELSRPAGGKWFSASETGSSPPHIPTFPFRVQGKGCSVRLFNLVDDTGLRVDNIDFDLSRQPGAADLVARLTGMVNQNEEKKFEVFGRIASLDDFDLRTQSGAVSLEDVCQYLPAASTYVSSGSVKPSLRVAGYPGGMVTAALDLTFENFATPRQPAFLHPTTGSLNLFAQYDRENALLAITAGRLDADQASGRVEGTVTLSGPSPVFDLRLDADKLPITAALGAYLPTATEAYGDLSVELGAPYRLSAALRGTLKSPSLVAQASAASARLQFSAKKSLGLPGAHIELGPLQVSWDTDTRQPTGSLIILSGAVSEPFKGVSLSRLSCSALLADGTLRADPLSAEINGQPFFGRFSYDLEKKSATFSATGTLADLEKTPLHAPVPELMLDGTASVRCSGSISDKLIELEASADVTQTRVGFEWWLRKPIGTGAVIKSLSAKIVPHKTMEIRGEAAIDATIIKASLSHRWVQNKFKQVHVRVDIPKLDVNTAGKCMNIPYTATGTFATDGFYEWQPAGNGLETNVITLGGHFDNVTFLPKGCPVPLVCSNARVDVTMDNTIETTPTGRIVVHAEDAHIPPTSATWLLPLEPLDPTNGPAKIDDGKPSRTWNYILSGGHLEMPPWKGADFKGNVFDNGKQSGLSSFEANVDGGTVHGSYTHEKSSNIMRLAGQWSNIPAFYIIRHIDLPEVLEGRISGTVDYSMDSDDPTATLDGKASFESKEGHFLPQALAATFGGEIAGSLAQLHPSALTFSNCSGDVVLKGDHIVTDNMRVELPGMTLSGNGTWVTLGDIDYNINISVSPDTAEQIPLLRDSFNLEGLRLTQRNVDLGFHITGPASKPTSQLAGMPNMGVTLVSGAAEMTSQAVRVIDLPRQLLMSIFKTGGGILGASRQPQESKKNPPKNPLK